MAETPVLGLPYVQAAQAQKHVTVNEAFARLDALTQMTLESIGATAPPVSPGEGHVHAVASSGATGAWTGFDGTVALFSNGGWDFVAPVAGWRAWSVEEAAVVTFDGYSWVPGVAAFGDTGATTVHSVTEIEHDFGTGGTSVVPGALPAGVLVLGVSARVTGAIGGAASIDLGVSGDPARYGQGMDVSVGSQFSEIASVPTVYSGGSDLVLDAVGGSFDGTGQITLAIHTIRLTAPRIA